MANTSELLSVFVKKENIEVDYDLRYSDQQVILRNPYNEFFGKFHLLSTAFASVDLSDCNIYSSTAYGLSVALPDGVVDVSSFIDDMSLLSGLSGTLVNLKNDISSISTIVDEKCESLQTQVTGVQTEVDAIKNDYTTSAQVSAIAEGYFPTALSTINDNEISDYQNKNDSKIAIGLGATANGTNAVAIGAGASVEDVEGAIQLGYGTNSTTNSLQFMNTTVVATNGKIPATSTSFNNCTMTFTFDDATVSSINVAYFN